MKYFFETIYNGTNYHGWQIQNNALSVQEVLTETLERILNEPIEITGSGRTDTGVHALQQIFHVDISKKMEINTILFKLNNFLPADISIRSIRQVIPEASARFDAISRSYEYHIHQSKDPFLVGQSYYFRKDLSIEKMNEAAAILLSKSDFQCFSKVKTEVNHFLCNITKAEWISSNHKIVFTISANRFLRGMVRAIVGTLLDIGTDKTSLNDFKKIIDSKDRRSAGRSVPACGLFLTQVTYPKNIYID